MAQTDYQSELLEIWQNKRFSDSIAAKVYDGIKICSPESSNKPLVEWKVFMACVVEHSKGNGKIITKNYNITFFGVFVKESNGT